MSTATPTRNRKRPRSAAQLNADVDRSYDLMAEWEPVTQPADEANCRLDYSGVTYVVVCNECGVQIGPLFQKTEANITANAHRRRSHNFCVVERCVAYRSGKADYCTAHQSKTPAAITNPCSIEGCTRQGAKSTGMCSTCTDRVQRQLGKEHVDKLRAVSAAEKAAARAVKTAEVEAQKAAEKALRAAEMLARKQAKAEAHEAHKVATRARREIEWAAQRKATAARKEAEREARAQSRALKAASNG
jgi:hypothetical protein